MELVNGFQPYFKKRLYIGAIASGGAAPLGIIGAVISGIGLGVNLHDLHQDQQDIIWYWDRL